MWTLWLVTFGVVVGQGGSPAVVTPLATYQSEAVCKAAITQTWNGLIENYGKKNPQTPGTFFCVGGAPVKK